MDTVTLAVVFVAAWLIIVALYCVFKIFGGKAIDCVSCSCLSGPCCDCWGAGGEVNRYDRGYPSWLEGRPGYAPEYPGGYAHGEARLPPIIIVNKDETVDGDSSSEDDDTPTAAAAPAAPAAPDAPAASAAPAAPAAPVSLLLSSSSRGDAGRGGGRIVPNVVVVV